MIDTSQWRVSIGLWYCHQISYTTKKGTTTDISGWVESHYGFEGSGDEGGGNLTFSLVTFLLLLLIYQVILNSIIDQKQENIKA